MSNIYFRKGCFIVYFLFEIMWLFIILGFRNMPYLFSLTFILILVAYTALLKYADLEQYIKMMVWPISLSVLTHITVCFVVAFIYLGTDTTSLKVFSIVVYLLSSRVFVCLCLCHKNCQNVFLTDNLEEDVQHEEVPYYHPIHTIYIIRDPVDNHFCPETCSICLEDFTNNEELATICSNRHLFHKGCIQEWINTKEQEVVCPICRH